MKRKLSLILAAMMLVSIVSCGGDNTDNQTIGGESSIENPVIESTTADTTEESSLPDTYDLENYEFRVIRQTPSQIAWSLNEFAPEIQTGEVLNDAFWERNQKAMEKYNFSITVTDDDQMTKNVVRKSVLAGDDEYDIALIRIDEEKNSYDGTYLNLLELPNLDLEKSWWDGSLVRDMTINGQLTFITGDIIVCENDSMYMTMYNSALGADFNIGNLYETVREGKWTTDKMYSCMKLVNADLDNNNIMDEKDRYGLLYADNAAALPYFAAADTYLFTGSGNEISYNANSERAYKVYETMQNMLSDKTMSYNWSELKTDISVKIASMIENKQVLFQTMVLSFVRRNFRDIKSDFGLLPMPKLDEAQESYATCIGIATPYIFVPSTVSEPDKVGFILEALAYESKNITETYYTVAMQSKYTRDPESYEMIELAQKNIVFDLGFIFDFGGLTTKIKKGLMDGTPYASLIDSNETAAKEAIKQLYENIGK